MPLVNHPRFPENCSPPRAHSPQWLLKGSLPCCRNPVLVNRSKAVAVSRGQPHWRSGDPMPRQLDSCPAFLPVLPGYNAQYRLETPMVDVPNHPNLPDQDWATDPVPDELPDNGRSPTDVLLVRGRVHDALEAHHSQPRRHIPFETCSETAVRPTNLREMRKITVDTTNYGFMSVVLYMMSLSM